MKLNDTFCRQIFRLRNLYSKFFSHYTQIFQKIEVTRRRRRDRVRIDYFCSFQLSVDIHSFIEKLGTPILQTTLFRKSHQKAILHCVKVSRKSDY